MIVSIPEKDIDFDFKLVSVRSFRSSVTVNDGETGVRTKYPKGPFITVILGDAPSELIDEIDNLVESYCSRNSY